MNMLTAKKEEKAHKTKITALINREVFDSFNDAVKELGLRRDAYINQVLSHEIEFLNNKVSAGSKSSELLLRSLRSRQKDYVKVGITLDSTLAKKLTAVCSDKNILRDQFLETCLDQLGEVLGEATTMILNPFTSRDVSGVNPYEHLVVSDEDVASFFSKLSQINKK